jgi:hypothetical protein
MSWIIHFECVKSNTQFRTLSTSQKTILLLIKEIYNYTIISTKDKEDDEESPTMDGNWIVNKKEMIIYKLVPTLNTWHSNVLL